MSSSPEDLGAQDHDVRLEEEGDGKFAIYMGNSRVVWIGPTYANPSHRECHWEIRGPMNLDQAVAVMKKFLHLTALLGNEQRVNDRPPASPQVSVDKEQRKWVSKTIRRSRS